MDFLLNEKYSGIVAITILIAGLIFLIRKWPKDIHHTFSQHAATNKTSAIYYFLLFAIVLPLLAVFLFSWFVPFFNVPVVFTILVGLSVVFQYACTLIPEVGKHVSFHRILAGISGLLLLPSLVLCFFASDAGMIDRIICGICIVAMIGVIVLVSRKRTGRALILQSIYFIAFFAPILIISYI